MSGLTRVNQQRLSERSSHASRTGTPSAPSFGPGSGYGPGSGLAAGPAGYGSGPGSGLGYGSGPGSGLGYGSGPGSGLGYGSGPGSGVGGRGSPFPVGGRGSPLPRPGSGASGASQYSESPFGGGMKSNSNSMGGQAGPSFGAYGSELEQHNDDLLSGLLGKVNTLKDLTKGIGKEVRDGNLELSGMNDTFGSTGNMLSGTFRRMTKMARRQGSNWCYFMGFLVLVLWIFIIVWWLRR
ncbi:hypothetical protein CcaverHIS002_0601640 [Cutaneotrichosporon cavernicola]|uniref:t-SNARE coiled-coil homology domain-containing protein n=1 Tax=Cutaneotrichosporon cavernicola TaxID=279322 RepID=A0AA48L5X6_9TREE|nr:uncharacterized protein CcaverHIS019_0501740 [Cutaneotrichosporon cavernicola]BEI85877.1 hypothetical protein CcaverHIS002_0601640 [Cutaneotrichosporon cavernicola]BEI92546.1 hypothetical protein CcaverHIS019_0501740 [Cutaneotrichosporon cavernicola]BEJ00319.1 hypothetical protein CcaverHIS631_0501760 [Cutaneotrichosporon cavernicola]BEJ08089.1 hypothetical protein CcaverHIS641_0501740 [Cutaneotrichosporon cavernicola]